MIRVRGIKIRVDKDNFDTRLKKVSKALHVDRKNILNLEIKRQSLDARNKKEVFYVYDFLVSLKTEEEVLKNNVSENIYLEPIVNNKFYLHGSLKLPNRIIVVGSGPAGLFASYFLAMNGYKPLIIERGKRIEERVKDVEDFWKTNILKEESNVQFGEGGAGTFSDGKLNTLVKDKENLIAKVFSIFVKHGAPKEILYLQNPHIGTDILRDVIKSMREEIKKMGGEFRYQTKLTNLIIEKEELKAIEVNDEEIIPCSNLILAIGHSARDTFEMLYKNALEITSKPFAVGIRVMHKQRMINENQYGEYAKFLKPANYKLTYTTKKRRGVYSFCMCPGGYVVNASSEKNHLVVNGMSNYQRETEDANSAIIVTVSKEDYGEEVLSGINYQRNLESLAYQLANGKVPLQLLKDFQNNVPSKELGEIKPFIKGTYQLCNLRDILPDYITEALLEAFPNFEKKIKGFANPDVLLVGIETRTSSPIRIKRDENLEANIKGIYPSGEGSGYAGGITTSAIDGIKVAIKIMNKYKP